MWGFIYGNNFGLAASINDWLGHDLVTPFAPRWMLVSLGNIVTWEYVGYNMIIFYSALKTIPADLYEAAEIDGARGWQVIKAIKLPAARGAIVIATIFSIIGSFQLFNEPNVLKPLANNVITSSYTPNMYAYNLSFAGQQYNYSATIAIIMGVIVAVIAYVVQLRGSRKEDR
jgi:multiple sugar transport system permease protein